MNAEQLAKAMMEEFGESLPVDSAGWHHAALRILGQEAPATDPQPLRPDPTEDVRDG